MSTDDTAKITLLYQVSRESIRQALKQGIRLQAAQSYSVPARDYPWLVDLLDPYTNGPNISITRDDYEGPDPVLEWDGIQPVETLLDYLRYQKAYDNIAWLQKSDCCPAAARNLETIHEVEVPVRLWLDIRETLVAYRGRRAAVLQQQMVEAKKKWQAAVASHEEAVKAFVDAVNVRDAAIETARIHGRLPEGYDVAGDDPAAAFNS